MGLLWQTKRFWATIRNLKGLVEAEFTTQVANNCGNDYDRRGSGDAMAAQSQVGRSASSVITLACLVFSIG